ncbi:inner membrane protein [Escherichia coli]|uniref:Inner membrane protein n=1 Tax=Escherichia coli TaxID=562 RepID=A0A484X332_ECOLX|nr:inner membrane protein [Escherichia coli]
MHVCWGDDVFYGYPRSGRCHEYHCYCSSCVWYVDGCLAASIGKGATLHKPKFSEALRTGLIFGAVETLTPLIGWGMGMLASRFVLEWNHWIAFVLLIFLGGRMIIEGFRGADDEDEEPRRRHGFWLLVTTAIATSLDAMAVGVGLAFLQVNIIATALAIGCATLIMSTIRDDGWSLYRLNYWEKSGNSRRAGTDRYWRPDPLDALPRLIRTLPEVNIKVRLAVEHFFCCQCLPDFRLRTPGKRRHLQ